MRPHPSGGSSPHARPQIKTRSLRSRDRERADRLARPRCGKCPQVSPTTHDTHPLQHPLRPPALTKRYAKLTTGDPHCPVPPAIVRGPRRGIPPPIRNTRHARRTRVLATICAPPPVRCFPSPLLLGLATQIAKVMRGPRIDRSRARRKDRRSSIEALHVASERARRRQFECSREGTAGARREKSWAVDLADGSLARLGATASAIWVLGCSGGAQGLRRAPAGTPGNGPVSREA